MSSLLCRKKILVIAAKNYTETESKLVDSVQLYLISLLCLIIFFRDCRLRSSKPSCRCSNTNAKLWFLFWNTAGSISFETCRQLIFYSTMFTYVMLWSSVNSEIHASLKKLCSVNEEKLSRAGSSKVQNFITMDA